MLMRSEPTPARRARRALNGRFLARLASYPGRPVALGMVRPRIAPREPLMKIEGDPDLSLGEVYRAVRT